MFETHSGASSFAPLSANNQKVRFFSVNSRKQLIGNRAT
jgi:hypothetical protein